MKHLSTNNAALLGLAFIGAVLLVISQTAIVDQDSLLAAAGFAVLLIASVRILDMTGRPNRED